MPTEHSPDDATLPANAKLDLAWTLIDQDYPRLLPDDKLRDLERAAELFAESNPAASARDIAAWLIAPYAPAPRAARSVSPIPANDLLPLTWERLARGYGKAYAAETRATLEAAAKRHAAENPEITPAKLARWLMRRMHVIRYGENR